METFYINDKPLFAGAIESLEYEPNISPLDLMNRSYLCNIEPEPSVVLHVTNGILRVRQERKEEIANKYNCKNCMHYGNFEAFYGEVYACKLYECHYKRKE